MSFIVDSSVTVAWCLPDEQTPALLALQNRAFREAMLVPSIWSFEMINVLGLAQRKGRLTEAGLQLAVAILEQFDIRIQPSLPVNDFASCWTLMSSLKLSGYDAAYLALALHMGLPLATLDKQLAAAAERLGVPLLL